MNKIELTVQGAHTLVGMRSKSTQDAAAFIKEALKKTHEALGGRAGVPFLAFVNLSKDTLAADENAYIEAGYATDAPIEETEEIFCVTLPASRVLSFTLAGEPESRSGIYASFAAYAGVFNLKLQNRVYEYYFIKPGENEGQPVGQAGQKITTFVVPIDDSLI